MIGTMIIIHHDSWARGGVDDWDHDYIINHDLRVCGGGGDDWDHDQIMNHGFRARAVRVNG